MYARKGPLLKSFKSVVLVLVAFVLLTLAFYNLGDRSNYSSNGAYVTLVSTESYFLPARVWATSLRESKTTKKIVLMATPGLYEKAKKELHIYFDDIVLVKDIESPAPKQDELRDYFTYTWTKLRVWELTQYDKVVFMDADILVRQNIDELFAQPELSAVEDCCDYFNSGMMVLVPSAARFRDMMDQLPKIRSHDGADQGFLNVYFSKWNHLPFFYNALQTTYLNYNFHKAWKQQADKIKCIHFIEFKPWKKSDQREDLKELHDEWIAMKAKADALAHKN